MKVYFWGSRGSLPASIPPASIREKITKALQAANGRRWSSKEEIHKFIDTQLPFCVGHSYGANTACVEIENPGEDFILCDAGSGLRDFAHHYMRKHHQAKNKTFHIFLSHLHWDHIQGFPFFSPAYLPDYKIIIHGHHPQTEQVFRDQMKPPVFPVEFNELQAEITFDIKPPGEPFEVASFGITSIEQDHPGKSYGYRFERDNKTIIYSTDSEHKQNAFDNEYSFVDFFASADLLIFDAMYSLADASLHKADWGHSSNLIAVELAARAQAKKLVLFHNEPTASDDELHEFLINTQTYADIFHSEIPANQGKDRYPIEIALAHDGLEIEI